MQISIPIIQENQSIELATRFVNFTNRNIFLSGGAGTGKTTFLKNLRTTCHKNLIIVAPSGIAAINAGGMTIHSFFQLPTDLIQQKASGSFAPRPQQFSRGKSKAIKALQLLIIDEISMVRADVLDAIDLTLKIIRDQKELPFGGVQLLLVGDLYQLPPVLGTEERTVFANLYNTPYFFGASVMDSMHLIKIELKEVFRQSDNLFVEILNKIRNNKCTEKDIDFLNEKAFKPIESDSKLITLTTHNVKAEAINREELLGIPENEVVISPTITGEFPASIYPIEKDLILKRGARIVFIRNDTSSAKRFFNGQQGIVFFFNNNNIQIEVNNEIIEVKREVWVNTQYAYSEITKKIEPEIIGEFHQFPIQLAWAITIHKSQGLTFERAIIDLENSFTPGQVYVALSRLKSIEGLILRSQIKLEHIAVDSILETFINSFTTQKDLHELIITEIQNFLQTNLLQLLSIDNTNRYITELSKGHNGAPGLQGQMDKLHAIAETFKLQLTELFSSGSETDYSIVHTRIKAAVNYYEREWDKIISDAVTMLSSYRSTKESNQQRKNLKEALLLFKDKTIDFQNALTIASEMDSNLPVNQVLLALNERNIFQVVTTQSKPAKKEKIKPASHYLQIVNFIKDRKDRASIAEQLGISINVVDQEILKGVYAGGINVHDVMEPTVFQKVAEIVSQNNDKSAAYIHKMLIPEVSLMDVKLVIANKESKNTSS